MSVFARVPLIPADPIFGLNSAFNNDPRSYKVNLGVGSYKDDDLQPFILASVKKAEEIIYNEQTHKEYLPIDGERDFVEAVQRLIFSNQKTLYGAQAIGGTGALKIGAEFIRKYISKKIYISDPTWDNHRRIFLRAGYEIASYSYYDRALHIYNHKKCLADIEKMDYGSIILLHGACHNPTGCDPTMQEWEEISHIISKRNLIPFFDAAYLGFGETLEEDTKPLKYFVKNHDCLIGISFSKSFGLYSERVGIIFFNSLDEKRLKAIASAAKVIIRSQYSNPPCHGALIVKTILKHPSLHKQWLNDLDQMRIRLTKMRKLFYERLSTHPKLKLKDFTFLLKQKGLFSFSGLNSTEVEVLARKYGIYLPKNGRVNVAGLNEKNIDYVIDSIAETV